MPIEAVQHRGVVRYSVLKGNDCETIIYELRSTYNEESPSQRTIYHWYNELKNGRLSVMDEDCLLYTSPSPRD